MVGSLKDCGSGFEQVGRVLRDVAPEEQPAVQRLQRGDDLLHEVEIDRAEPARVDVGLGLADAEVDGLVGADVEEGAGILGGELRELLLDEGDGAGLAGREHGAVGRLGERLVLLPRQRVVQVPEGFLLGHDGDVVGARVGDQGCRVGRGDGSAGRRDERVRRVRGGVLEVGRVEIDLVRREGADHLLLELQRGDGAAGEVVVQAAILHRRPVADRRRSAGRRWRRSR